MLQTVLARAAWKRPIQIVMAAINEYALTELPQVQELVPCR